MQDLPVNHDGTAKFRVGLMLFTETGSPNNNVDGGYVRAAVTGFRPRPTRTLFIGLVDSLHILNDKSNGGKAGLTMMEAYYYFDGGAPRSGNNKVKTDYTGNSRRQRGFRRDLRAAGAMRCRGRNGSHARGPPTTAPSRDGSCGKNFIIYISNGAVQDNNSDTRTARERAGRPQGGNTTTIPISPSGSQTNVADEWARFMYSRARTGSSPTRSTSTRSRPARGRAGRRCSRAWPTVSDGKYFDVSSGNGGEKIEVALEDIFSRDPGASTACSPRSACRSA